MSVGPTVLSLLAIVALTAGTAVFVAAEFSLTTLERSTVDANARSGSRRDHYVQRAHRTLSFQLSGAQLGISITTLVTGCLTEPLVAQLPHPALDTFGIPDRVADAIIAFVALVVVTSLSMVFGELVPKQLALRQPERLAVLVARPLGWLALLAKPAVWVLEVTTRLVLRAFGPAGVDRRAMSEEELKAMLVEGAETGVLETEERDMIERVLRLADKPVRAIMTPRTEIDWLDRTASRGEIIATLRNAPHSRFVVCDGSIDNVVGIVQTKEILDRILEGKDFSLAAAIRQPMAIPDSVSALETLERLKSDPFGIAIVFDEYGSFEGMVTAADVLEAIVGDLEEPPKEGARPALENVYEFDGLMPVDEIKARLDLPDLPKSGTYHTLGGLILTLLLRPPRVGDAIVFGGWKFEVLTMDGRRVERVRVEKDSSG
jgi:putative hemolysin